MEEANLHRVKIKVMRSDIENLIVAGFHFYVCVRYSKKVGWNVVQACCREGDDLVLFLRERIMVNNDKCDILTGL